MTTVLQQEHAHAWCDARIKELTDENEACRALVRKRHDETLDELIKRDRSLTERLTKMTNDRNAAAAEASRLHRQLDEALTAHRKRVSTIKSYADEMESWVFWLVWAVGACSMVLSFCLLGWHLGIFVAFASFIGWLWLQGHLVERSYRFYRELDLGKTYGEFGR
jgi:hypothetical protein